MRVKVAVAVLLVTLTTLSGFSPWPRVAMASEIGVDDEPIGLRYAGAGKRHGEADDVESFQAIGVSWTNEAVGNVRVRVRTAAGWQPWTTLEAEDDDGPDLTSPEHDPERVVSEPLWAGEAEGYEVELGSAADAVEVHVVRERQAFAPLAPGTEEAGAATGPVKPSGVQRRIVWAARTPKTAPISAASVRYAVVHHTVSSNSYAAADVPRMLRAIQTYHMDVNGWNDIAYNFLVDRFGRIWEGRGGGLRLAVVGAHARGFNTGSVGVAVLGDFSSAGASAQAVEGVSAIVGWKLALGGVNPGGTTTVVSGGSSKYPAGTSVALANVSGHRDNSYTICPGAGLYDRLGDIRARATQLYPPA